VRLLLSLQKNYCMCSTLPGHAMGKCSCKLAHLCKRRQQLEKVQRIETFIAIPSPAKIVNPPSSLGHRSVQSISSS
jgi:hypothetical protein